MIGNNYYIFQPHKDKNEIFSSIRPQINVSRKGFLYGPRHMRKHIIEYTKENYTELEEELKDQLTVRRQSLQNYIQLMEWTPTSGAEITLLIVARMFNVTILVVRGDFVWLSKNIAPIDANIVLVQNCNGHFVGTKHMDEDKPLVDVGEVPRIIVNKRSSAEQNQTSTPKSSSRLRRGKEMEEPNLSPIVEVSSHSNSIESGFSLDNTTDSTKQLRDDVKKLVDNTLDQCGSEVVVPSTTKDAQKMHQLEKTPKVTLNIKDIGNNTSSAEGQSEEFLTPSTSGPIDITSPIENSVVTNDETQSPVLNIQGKSDDASELPSIRTESADKTLSAGELSVEVNSSTLTASSTKVEKEESSDSEATVDADYASGKSEISEDEQVTEVGGKSEISDEAAKNPEKSEISDVPLKKDGTKKSEISYDKGAEIIKCDITGVKKTKETVSRKRLGSNGPVTVTKNTEKIKYKDIPVVKMGCNKCTEVFYSEGAYKRHLFEAHRIRNASRHAPTIINRLWTRLPEMEPKKAGEQECDICGARYRDAVFFFNHTQKCKPRTIDEEEDKNQCLYRMIEEDQKEKKKAEEDAKEAENEEPEKNVIGPSQPKKPRRSRSLKKNWTKNRKRKRNTSEEESPGGCKIFVRKQVDSKFVQQADANKDNVEYYQGVLNRYKTSENNDDISDETSNVNSESKDEKDSDYKVSSINESTTSEESKPSPLPSITRPRTRLQLRRSQQRDETPKQSTDDGQGQTVNSDKIESAGSDAAPVSEKADSTSANTSEIPSNKDNAMVVENMSEISDKDSASTKPESTTVETSEKPKNKSHNKPWKRYPLRGRNKDNKTSYDSKGEDAVNEEDEKKDTSEISDSQSGIQTRSKIKNKKTCDKEENPSEKDYGDKEENEEDNQYYTCKICSQTFSDHKQYKHHKISCTVVPKKHSCPKCGKQFTQKSLLNQHFDYRHTNKPKKFVCLICSKSFELKKSLQEHNHRLHDTGDKKYLCDFCSRGFWHFGEFTVHRASHTGLKPFTCGRCQQKSFACADRLTKHLKRCGSKPSSRCNTCGKLFSDDRGLAKHVKETHGDKMVWNCPFCDGTYNSEGGYYYHLRHKHNIGRNGKKLSTALIEKEAGKEVDSTPQNPDEESEETEEKKDEESTSQTREKETSSSDEDSNGGGKMKQEPKSQDPPKKSCMTHKCPFPKCNDLELENEELYFEHLWTVHKLGRNK